MQADAEGETPSLADAAMDAVSIFFATSAGGSPQVRYLSTDSAATSIPAFEEPPK